MWQRIRQSNRRSSWCLASVLCLSLPATLLGQSVSATIPVGTNPDAIALNPLTNKIYVANCGHSQTRDKGINGTITVIDGDSNTTTTLSAGMCPIAVAVNPATNKIYVANFGHTSLYCGSCFDYGSITVIDGETNTTTTVVGPNAKFPQAIAVNQVTNKVYVANNFSANVTVIDGTDNSVTAVSTESFPYNLAVNSSTNKIYVSSFNPFTLATSTALTVIDGATNTPISITDSKAADPIALAVNPLSNKLYVANLGNLGKNGTNAGSITVVSGGTNSTTNITDPTAVSPHAVVVDAASNKTYVLNASSSDGSGNGGVTVLDGTTNSTVHITDPNAGTACYSFRTNDLAADPIRDLVYVANCGNNISVIDGATNTVTTVTDSSAVGPIAVAVNSLTNKIYVANAGSNNVTVIDGGVGTQQGFTLSVSRAGSGSGSVNSNPAGIDCGSTCSENFAGGTPVTLTATPDPSSTFAGWSGSCSGVSACSIVINADTSVIANFIQSQTLNVILAGNGSGAVTSNSGGISCTNAGGSCSARLATGTAVLLTAVPSGNSVFAGWSGACTGTDPNTCSITLDSNKTVTTTFNPPLDFTLSPASQNLSVKRGSQAGDVLTISAQSGFSGSIALICSVSGPPPMPTCGISPGSVTPGTNATLTVNAAALTAALTSRPFERAETLFATVLPLGLMSLVLIFFDKKRRKFWALSPLILLATILPAACGGSSSAPPPPQNYTVTVTAQSGVIQHSTTVSVTVN